MPFEIVTIVFKSENKCILQLCSFQHSEANRKRFKKKEKKENELTSALKAIKINVASNYSINN